MIGWICPVCGKARPPHWDECCTADVAHEKAHPSIASAQLTAATAARLANADVVALEAKNKRPSPKRRSYNDPLFDEFWDQYVLKLDKKKAHEAWCRIAPDDALAHRIIAGAKRYAEYVRRNRVELRHVKYAQGWLNAERWNDRIDLPPKVGEGPSYEEQQKARIAEEEAAIKAVGADE